MKDKGVPPYLVLVNASAKVLCPLLVTILQEGYTETGEDTEVSDQNDQRDGIRSITYEERLEELVMFCLKKSRLRGT